MTNILEVNNLVKNYDSFSLKDVSFSVPAGLIMGFIGPNGAGKTTTIKSILNMITPNAGTISLFGMDNKENTMQINEQIGVVMDAPCQRSTALSQKRPFKLSHFSPYFSRE